MDTRTLPDVETLRQLFIYDAETGDLIWRERPIELFESKRICNSWNTKYASKKAGSEKKGKTNYYMKVKIYKSHFLAHRIVWKMHYGEEPPKVIDHINGNGLDNKISNLRAASVAQNAFNSRKMENNTSGYKGIDFIVDRKKWRARIAHNGNKVFIGNYKTPEEAHEAYQKAAAAYHGEFYKQT